MKYALLSAQKFKDKIQEDIILKDKLSNLDDNCEILAWEEVTNNEINNYDVFVVRSVWGYHLKYQRFIDLIKDIENSGKVLINSYKNIYENISKLNQYKFCKNSNLDIIPSYFITNKNEYNYQDMIKELKIDKSSEIVVKPIISASGDGVEKIRLSEFDINKYTNYLGKDYQGIVIQPYVKSIKNGEYSAIVINNNLQYVALRFPGVIESEKSVELLNNIPKKLYNQIQKAMETLEILKTTYYRLDFFEYLDNYYINEIEMTDPDLFTRKIDKDIANDTLTAFANEIKNTALNLGEK